MRGGEADVERRRLLQGVEVPAALRHEVVDLVHVDFAGRAKKGGGDCVGILFQV